MAYEHWRFVRVKSNRAVVGIHGSDGELWGEVGDRGPVEAVRTCGQCVGHVEVAAAVIVLVDINCGAVHRVGQVSRELENRESLGLGKVPDPVGSERVVCEDNLDRAHSEGTGNGIAEHRGARKPQRQTGHQHGRALAQAGQRELVAVDRGRIERIPARGSVGDIEVADVRRGDAVHREVHRSRGGGQVIRLDSTRVLRLVARGKEADRQAACGVGSKGPVPEHVCVRGSIHPQEDGGLRLIQLDPIGRCHRDGELGVKVRDRARHNRAPGLDRQCDVEVATGV